MLILALALSIDEAEKIDMIFRQYERKLLSFLYKTLGDKKAAEDARQETFVQLCKNADKIGDPGSVATKNYIYRIAENKAIDSLRKKNRTEAVTNPYDENVITMMGELESRRITASAPLGEWIGECLQELSRDDQDILVLKYGLEWDDIGIAKFYGISHDAARQRLSRARRRTAAIIEGKRKEGLEI
ncbi:MAG: sigma-70 family RNA polymerase sigma factor [Parabacteroides sp.]|nr:sigma-70 family RNA polymerase sigma factor [Parabacteroides sp.]